MDFQNEPHSYENGSTQPPKNRQGRTFVFLCLSILLCGVLLALKFYFPDGLPGTGNSMIFTEITGSAPAQSVSTFSQENFPCKDADIALIPQPDQEDVPLQDIYEKNIPSVVSITCTFSDGSGSGTGVVLSENGYLVTNDHVISDARDIQVLLTDGRTYKAQIVGKDKKTDLAVLYIAANDLIPAEFGDSSQLRIGDTVVAIGDPLGLEFRGTMTNGIISAIDRDMEVNGWDMTLLQTNAALNIGNSGGPLINSHGQVIGINTVKIQLPDQQGDVEGMGFAIPSETVRDIVNEILEKGYVSHP